VQRIVDYSALTRPTTRAEVSAFKSATLASGKKWAAVAPVNFIVIGVVIVLALVFLLNSTSSALSAVVRGVFSGSSGASAAIIVPAILVVGLGTLFVVLATVFGSSRWKSWMRLSQFADANGFVFSPSDANPSYPGSIFGLGHTRASSNHLRTFAGRFLDYGNYTYATGSGKSRAEHKWGFLALGLDRSLPHMILDAKSNNSFFRSNLPSTFSKDQVLSLEGDFDEYFTLYCPAQYETDALYVFTPDLMALLIDEASPFDVEIIDNWMFVYSTGHFSMLEPAVHERLLRIVDTVGAKTLTQTARYADERVGNPAANIVAPQGRRLARGFPAALISLGVLVLVGIAINILSSIVR